MATARITDEYPITYDATKAPVPYGRWAPGLITRWLTSRQVYEKQRTLFTLCDYLHDPEHITCCLQTGLVTVLCRLLEDDDSIVRHKSAQCLGVIAGHAVGREDLLRRDALTHLSWRFGDSVPLVRRNAHQVVTALLKTPEGVEAGLACDLIPQLLSHLLTELGEIMLLCLTSLQPLLREDPRRGLVLGGVRTMNQLLLSEVSSIRAAAAACLHYLCLPTQGKNEATALGSLPLLVRLLKDWDSAVRTQAAAAAGAVLVTTPAKMLAMQLPMLDHLLALTREGDVPEARMLALQALATLASHPEARRRLRAERDVLDDASQSPNEGVSRCAARALEEVLWDP
ncbi:radial spoke head 14 homolog [Pollicipes pollicipes]|uniref:radial spoke head 14 homolog n=1 Tax=Pollicipes pollicipes TaxID=41117 RepID=UPI001884D288|nr:radial spoke head 14 homolog [Pollicipes pollicipes]XP_037085927.1 radial spoke head 14 homolog [Pollicipes pollicipes]